MSISANKIVRNEAGFSLIETLVAVFLLSIVSLVSLNIMSNFADANQAMSNQVAHLDKLEQAINYIQDDMRNVIKRPTHEQDSGGRISLFTSENNTANRKKRRLLRFTRGSNALATADHSISPTETIEYWIEDKKLIRRAYDRPDPTMETPFRDYVILEGVAEIDVLYFEGYIWVNDWMSGQKAATTKLPRAIDISWSMTDEISGLLRNYKKLFTVGML